MDAVEDTGSVAYLHATAKLGQELVPVVVRLPGGPAHGKGAELRVAVRADAVHCFSAATGLRLSDPTDVPRAAGRLPQEDTAAPQSQDAVPVPLHAPLQDAAPAD
ncbi:hypothetical protein OG381_02040 [Streptomyces sp. NBC_00490]|uniref:hypothetical protein n=1 Tax=Streptomyces sp. NBC_00490 TaxID=2903657 RepID=UPI002E18628A